MEVVFYKLSSKFVDGSREIPEGSREVMYYSLAVGHHTGVIDCLSEALRCDLADYLEFCSQFTSNEQAYYKLVGVERNGEIQIDRSHLPLFNRGGSVQTAGQESGQNSCQEPCQEGIANFEAQYTAVFEREQQPVLPGEPSDPTLSAAARKITDAFWQMLDDIRSNPALYLTVRQS